MADDIKQSKNPNLICIGSSLDSRTNRWQVTCLNEKCGHKFSPPTTLLAWDHITCPKCATEMQANYNEETLKIIYQPPEVDSHSGKKKGKRK